MHDIESMRALEGLPSSLVTYFINDSLNKNVVLSACMEGIAEQVRSYYSRHNFMTHVLVGYKRLSNSFEHQSISADSAQTTFR